MAVQSEHPALLPLWWLLYIIVAEGTVIGVRYLAVLGSGFSFPFFWIAIYSVIGFLAAVVYYSVNVIKSFDSETKFYLRPGDYLVLGLISAGEHCLGVLALTYTSISIGNYLFLFQVHFLFQLILSAIFLRRKPTLLQSFATLLILGAIAVFVLIQYNGMGSTAVELLPSFVTLQAWGYVWGAALCRAGRGVLATYMVHRRLRDEAAAVFREEAVPALTTLSATALYDPIGLSYNVQRSMETDFVGGLLSLCPIALIVSFFVGEAPYTFLSIATIPYASWICFGIMALGLAAAPFIRAKVALCSSPRTYSLLWAAGPVLAVITGNLLLAETLSVTQIIGLIALAGGVALFHFAMFPSARGDGSAVQQTKPVAESVAAASVVAHEHAVASSDYSYGGQPQQQQQHSDAFNSVGPAEPIQRSNRVAPAPYEQHHHIEMNQMVPSLHVPAPAEEAARPQQPQPQYQPPQPQYQQMQQPQQQPLSQPQPGPSQPRRGSIGAAPVAAAVVAGVAVGAAVYSQAPAAEQQPAARPLSRPPSVTRATPDGPALPATNSLSRRPSALPPLQPALPPPPSMPAVTPGGVPRLPSVGLTPAPPLGMTPAVTPSAVTPRMHATPAMSVAGGGASIGSAAGRPLSVSVPGLGRGVQFSSEEDEAGDSIDFSHVSAADREK